LLGLVERLDQIGEIRRMKFSRMLAQACDVTLGRKSLQALLALLDIVFRRAH
jgi:hypothetical protein